jgi:hypothetical protein
LAVDLTQSLRPNTRAVIPVLERQRVRSMGGFALETIKSLEPVYWSCHDNFDRDAD